MLTDQQKSDVRRYAGYPLLADQRADDSRDFAYGWVLPGVMQTLAHRLDALRIEEEWTLINVYLTNLAQLESDVVSTRDNLDTDAAAVWTHNKNEVRDRMALFDQWRWRMVDFLGIPAGPMLRRVSGVSISRA
jgi:hypothetical protein